MPLGSNTCSWATDIFYETHLIGQGDILETMPPVGRRYASMRNERSAAFGQQYMNPPLSKKQREQVLRAVKKRQEPKQIVFVGGANMVEGSHYVINPLYNITQGLTTGNRIGQSINLDSVEFEFSLKAAANASNFWVYAFWSDVESITASTAPTQVTTPNVVTTLPILGAPTASGENVLAFLDELQCTKLRSNKFDLNNSYSGQASFYTGKIKLKFKSKKLVYLHDTASYFEGKNLYIGITSSVQGTVDTTATATMYHSTLVKFRE